MPYSKYALPAFLLGLLLFLGGGLPVFAQELPDSWLIRSTYAPATSSSQAKSIDWNYSTATSGSGTRVSAESPDSSIITKTDIFFDQDGMMRQGVVTLHVRGTDKQNSRQFAAGAPAILNDSLAPADWLNLDQETARSLPQTLNARTQHANQVAVSRTLIILQEDISIAQALEQGMLDPDLADSLTGPLTMFVVVQKKRDSQQEILRQLWASGDFWWVYEAKDSRTSLRLAN